MTTTCNTDPKIKPNMKTTHAPLHRPSLQLLRERLVAQACRVLRNREDAEDVVQEAFVLMTQDPAWRGVPDTVVLAQLQARVAQLAHRQRTRVGRAADRHLGLRAWVLACGGEVCDPAEYEERAREVAEVLQTCLAALTRRQREVIEAHVYGGEPIAAIAHRLGLSRQCVYGHWDLGLRTLKVLMKARGVHGSE